MCDALVSARTAATAFVPAPCKRGDELFGPRANVLRWVGKRTSLMSAIRFAGPIGSAFFAEACTIELNVLGAALAFPD